jgi:hypothetical protein
MVGRILGLTFSLVNFSIVITLAVLVGNGNVDGGVEWVTASLRG